MKAIFTLLLSLAVAIPGFAQTNALAVPAQTPPVTKPAAPGAPPARTFPALPSAPSVLPGAMPPNFTNMTPLQRRMFLLTNQAGLPTNLAALAAALTNRLTAPATPAATTPAPDAVAPVAPAIPAVPARVTPNAGLPAGVPVPAGVTPAPRPGVPGAVPRLPAGSLQPTPAGGVTNIPASMDDDELLPSGLIRFQEADLSQVLDIYGEITARTVLRPATLPAAKITLRAQTPLTRSEGARAIEAVLALNQISVSPVSEKFVKIVPVAQVHTLGAKPVDADKIVEFGPFVTHIYQLKYADAKEVTDVVTKFAAGPQSVIGVPSSQIIVMRDYAENVKRMLEMIEKVDVAITNNIEPVVIPIKYALATDIQQVLSSLTAGGGGGMSIGGTGTSGGGLSGGTSGYGGASRGRLSGSGRTFGTGSMGGGYGGAYGGSSTYPGGTGMNPLGTAAGTGAAGGSLAAARTAFGQRLGGIIKSSTQGGAGAAGDIQVISMAKIIADERANSLLIFADKYDLPIITNIINKLDVVLAQVLIETLIMEVSLNAGHEYGLSTKQVSASTIGNFVGIGALNPSKIMSMSAFASGGTNGSLSDGLTYIGRFAQDLDVTARAIATDSRANVISRPRILTSHAKEGRIFIGETRPYITGYYGGGGYGGGYGGYGGYGGGNYSQYQQLQIGIELTILPFINSEGLVVMDIQQSIQGIKGSVTINGNDVPITSDKQASAYIAVRDRDTVILGGYITSNSSRTHSGVPILKDIPVLGALFRSNKRDSDRTELVVLIRPTVLNSPEAAATATAIERDQLPGIRNAEKEYEDQIKKEQKAFENKNLKKTKKS
ncbi:MAG: hypothetical protein HZA90_03215 [Verrucomicrobia bacterium]|nr:hypothetical protein [Verrucomicrobiota bacterium]